MPLPCDIDKYRRHVEAFDLSEDQKVELIRTLWRIMESFADRAFGIDSAQQCRLSDLQEHASAGPTVLKSDPESNPIKPLTVTFRRHAEKRRRKKP